MNSSDNIFSDERRGTLLFHYTSLSNAISIVASKSLLFGCAANMNDLDESTRSIFCKHIDGNIIDRCVQTLQSYTQISLTSDGDGPKMGTTRRGFDIQTMWGLYADKGRGICLAFNKKRLLESFNKLTGIKKAGHVNYSKDYDSAIYIETDLPENEIVQRLDEIFFCKSDLWRSEQEYRIVTKPTPQVYALDISRCLEGVIFSTLGIKIDESPYSTKSYWLLKRVCHDIPIYRYVHRSIEGNRVLCRASDGEEVWSTGEIIDITSNEWEIDSHI